MLLMPAKRELENRVVRNCVRGYFCIFVHLRLLLAMLPRALHFYGHKRERKPWKNPKTSDMNYFLYCWAAADDAELI